MIHTVRFVSMLNKIECCISSEFSCTISSPSVSDYQSPNFLLNRLSLPLHACFAHVSLDQQLRSLICPSSFPRQLFLHFHSYNRDFGGGSSFLLLDKIHHITLSAEMWNVTVNEWVLARVRIHTVYRHFLLISNTVLVSRTRFFSPLSLTPSQQSSRVRPALLYRVIRNRRRGTWDTPYETVFSGVVTRQSR